MKEYNKANIPLAKARLVVGLDGGAHYTAEQIKKR